MRARQNKAARAHHNKAVRARHNKAPVDAARACHNAARRRQDKAARLCHDKAVRARLNEAPVDAAHARHNNELLSRKMRGLRGTIKSSPELLMAGPHLDQIRRFLYLIMQLSGKRTTSSKLQMRSKFVPQPLQRKQGAHLQKSRGTRVPCGLALS